MNDQVTFGKWKSFFKSLGISNFQSNELCKIDKTLGIFKDQQNLVATGSIAGDVLKYVGVCNKESTQGRLFNTIISALMNLLSEWHVFHVFVFTKKKIIPIVNSLIGQTFRDAWVAPYGWTSYCSM